MLQLLHPLLQVHLLLHEGGETLLELVHGRLQGLVNLHRYAPFCRDSQGHTPAFVLYTCFASTSPLLTCVLVAVLVAVLAVSVVVVVRVVVVLVHGVVTVVLLLQAERHGRLVPGCYVEPALLLQFPSGLVSLGLQLGQSSSDKFLL